MSEIKTKKNCAVYTRKSTEEGLDMEFNSLDAQYESCEKYIQIHDHEGWNIVQDKYEDGGFSGGTVERPALKRLLADIQARKINIVVVYKIDRLSRSLLDFLNLMKVFEEHEVSFVSVTQNFDTSTPMGKLMLNVLLSFAQFEREITGERIRDKIASSKRKGMWMGGVTPLGYEVKDRHLHIKEDEAASVRMIFDYFIMLKSVTMLVQQLPEMDIFSKKRISKNGREIGGTKLDKGSIYKILNNPIYIGKIRHKDNIYDGKHKPIISEETWEKAHKIIKESPRERSISTKRKTKAVLCGVLRCGGCNSSMTPCHTKKKGGKLYRYYGAVNYRKGNCPDCPVKQVTASEIEAVVLHQLKSIFAAPEMIIETWKEVTRSDASITEVDVRNALVDIFPVWNELFPKEQEQLLNLMLEKVVIYTNYVDVRVRADGLDSLVKELDYQKKQMED